MKIASKDIKYITFNLKGVFVYFKGRQNPSKLNCKRIILDSKIVNLSMLYDKYISLHENCLLKYKQNHEKEYNKEIPLYLNDKYNATAYHFRKHNDYENKLPMQIQMDIHKLKNKDEFLFTLGHEFAHYYVYKELKQMSKFNIIRRILVCMSVFYFKFYFIMSIISYLNNQENFILSFYGGLLSFLIPILLYENLIGMVFHAEQSVDIYSQHLEEYECDKESYNFFKKQINLDNTFLKKSIDLLSSTHPFSRDRYNYLKYNKKRFIYLIPVDMIMWEHQGKYFNFYNPVHWLFWKFYFFDIRKDILNNLKIQIHYFFICFRYFIQEFFLATSFNKKSTIKNIK